MEQSTQALINSLADINRHIKQWGQTNALSIDCGVAGKFDAEIAIVGNYVHEREKVMSMPFSGSIGETLWNALRVENITRMQVYQTIAIKKYIPAERNADNSIKDATVTNEQLDLYAALLNWELAQLPNLKYIVVLGDFALKSVYPGLPSSMLTQGSVYTKIVRNAVTSEERTCKLISILDIDTVNKSPKFKSTLAHNCEKLSRVLNGTYVEPIITVHYNKDVNFVIKYLMQLRAAKLPTALDIETVNDETSCIGFANKIDEALCINWRNETGNFYSVQEELKIRLFIQAWFDRTDEFAPKLIMQNGMFDSYFEAYKERMELPPSHFDTMLASHTLASTLPHNLAYLVSRYTDMPYYKDENKKWRHINDWPVHFTYNGKDCCGTLRVFYEQVKELKANILPEHFKQLYGYETQYDFFMDHVMRLQPHLIKMTVGGVLADTELKDQLAKEIAKDIDKLKKTFYAYVLELTGEPDYRPNFASPKQLGELLFTKCRLVGRGTATDAKNRARMIAHPKTSETARQMLITLNKIAKEQKFLSTYVNMSVDEDNRIRCEYKQTGVQSAPGRLSSTQTMWDSGGNLQNIPPRGQELFLIDEGYEASYFDLAQAEARIVGWRYLIHQWIEDFERARLEGGFDAHRSLASIMYKIPYDDVPKDDIDPITGEFTIRYKSKRCRHGLNYTMAGPLLAEQINVSANEGEVLYNLYHRVNPELQVGWRWTYQQVARDMGLYNAYGRKYVLLEPLNQTPLGVLVAFYFQSTIGDKVAKIIYQCHNDPEWPKTAIVNKRSKLNARMLLNIHDALIAIHKPEDGDTVRRIMKKYAEEPISIECIDGKIRECIVPADFKVSVPIKTVIKEVDGVKIVEQFPDKHRWSNLAKIKVAA
jgi:DNA polymerase I-like protein with 3'-5' exonuclease and polymerase domains/uracil-DNA glycosylase